MAFDPFCPPVSQHAGDTVTGGAPWAAPSAGGGVGNATAANQVLELAVLGAPNDAAVAAGAVGTISAKLRLTTTQLEQIRALLDILDDWDETDRAKVNIIAGQAGVAAGAGIVGASTQRVVLASDDLVAGAIASARMKTSPVAGQDGVAAGAGVVGATTQRVVLATDDLVAAAVASARMKTSPIPGQNGVAAGAGAADALTQRVIHATDDLVAGAIASARMQTSPVVGQLGVAAGAGVVGATTQRVVLATDDLVANSIASGRMKNSPIVGQDGIAAGTGVDGVTVPRMTLATNVGLPAGEAHLGLVGGITPRVTAQQTRPADATTYGLGDNIANSLTAASVVPITFAIARISGGSGRLSGMRCVLTAASGTIVFPAFDLLMFRPEANIPFAAAGYPADNAALVLTAAMLKEMIGLFAFSATAWRNNAGGVTAAGAVAWQRALPNVGPFMPYNLASIPSSNLLGLMQAQSAWAPGAIGYTFDFAPEVDND